MRRIVMAAVAAALASTSAAMWAADTSKAPDRLFCKHEPRTGSRFGRRSCISAKDREQRTQQQKRDASELIDRPVICLTNSKREGC